MKRENIRIAINDTDTISVERFCSEPAGIPVLMIHGSIENGKIFYSGSGKGLAPFLAAEGYDVYVPDLRGKGKSEPRVSRSSKHGQYEAITEDMPAVLARIRLLRGDQPVHLVAHSWGGVLLLAWYARFHQSHSVRSMIFFGTKRKIYIRTLKRFFMIDLMWNLAGRTAAAIAGYLPARAIGFGSDNEPRKFFLDTNRWVYTDSWTDTTDGLDYHRQLRQLALPPMLSLTGVKDDVLGHPRDVQKLLAETNAADTRYVEVGKKHGFRHDYGHIDLLTHPDAPGDHFQLVLEWMRQH